MLGFGGLFVSLCQSYGVLGRCCALRLQMRASVFKSQGDVCVCAISSLFSVETKMDIREAGF